MGGSGLTTLPSPGLRNASLSDCQWCQPYLGRVDHTDQHGPLIGRKKGALNPKDHVLADAKGHPIRMVLSAGQTTGDISAQALLGGWGHDAGQFRDALIAMGTSPTTPCHPGRKDAIRH